MNGKVDLAADVVELLHESADVLLGVIAEREVIDTPISVLNAVLKYVPGGRKHGGGRREKRERQLCGDSTAATGPRGVDS